MSTSVATNRDLTESEFDTLYHVLGGHIYFQTLSAAIKFDLFGLLKKNGPMSCPQIAGHLGIEEKPARILLLGCAALKLIEKSGPLYSNSYLAEKMFVRDVPGNVVSIVEWQHYINYRAMYWFHDAILENSNVGLKEFEGNEPTLYERLVHQPKLEKIFQDAMQSISVQANQMLAKYVDFSDVRHVVDVGGGNGSNIITLAEKHPHLRATVFDSPSVCQIAAENIKKCGLADRLNAIPGECFADAFPEGADCLLFCHFFTIWSEAQNQDLLRKCYEALPSGGRVIIFNMMQSDDETGPLSAALGSPYFLTLATGEGMLYTWQEYESWARAAGFASVTKQELPRDHGAIIATKA